MIISQPECSYFLDNFKPIPPERNQPYPVYTVVVTTDALPWYGLII